MRVSLDPLRSPPESGDRCHGSLRSLDTGGKDNRYRREVVVGLGGGFGGRAVECVSGITGLYREKDAVG